MLSTLFSLASPSGRNARLSIFIFHRVLPELDPLFPGEPTAEHFDTLCRWVAKWFRVLPLAEAVQRLRRGDLPARAAAITFDDGYADNHDIAAPILRRHALPATFFIASGFLDGGRMWNDTVIESVRRTPLHALELSDLLPAEHGAAALGTCLSVVSAADKRALLDQLLPRIKYLPPARREAVVAAIAERAAAQLPEDLMMRSEQVKALHAAGMGIGAHTVTHPILAQLDRSQMRREIGEGRDALASLVGERIALFAYPNGKPGKDYNHQSIEVVRELGFDAAVSTAWGAASGASDCHQLPRFTPWDRKGLRFAMRMWRNFQTPVALAA